MAIELLYIQPEKHEECLNHYLTLTKELLTAAPSFTPLLKEISPLVLAGQYYKALQKAKELLRREKELLELAQAAT
jgi:flagellar biosynthesis regulator FlbT